MPTDSQTVKDIVALPVPEPERLTAPIRTHTTNVADPAAREALIETADLLAALLDRILFLEAAQLELRFDLDNLPCERGVGA
jgi:hypothetical protein